MTTYKISWSAIGATYFRSFSSEKERDDFRKRIETGNNNVETWENTYDELIELLKGE